MHEWAGEFLDKILRGIEEGESEKRAQKIMENPAVSRRLRELPPHIRGIASRVIRSITAKLGNVGDEDSAELIEWILRYYESNVLRELMQAIASAETSDAEKLAKLISDWGVRQVASVTEIIKSQIEIVEKLETLVESDKVREIELHKLVESNLWLVREGLELWSSDRTLKTVLSGEIKKMYKDREDLRPDLICRSRNGGGEAVVIEFKRPKEKVSMSHITQVLEYKSILEEHRPNTTFHTYVVGRQFEPAVLNQARKALKEIHMWSYSELLQRTKSRFEEILKILGRDGE